MESIDSDSPLGDAKRDRLGFAPVADYLARTLLAGGSAESFVMGVEGEWGSGKTSLVELALKRLEGDESAPKVIRFQPWLVGTRDELLRELFKLIGEAVQAADPLASAAFWQRLSDFAQAASGAAQLAGVPLAPGIADAASRAAKAKSDALNSLAAQKKGLTEALKGLSCKLVVFIDDLDRLDPGEAAEVLRLVRAVADFPNITYVLAYDRGILSRNLETALRLSPGAGDDYIEKIVQVTFRVPKPEAFDLPNWFAAEARKLLKGALRDESAKERFEEAVARWVHVYLKTPRDVIRALNALRLYGAPQVDDIDAGDMVFAQLIRLNQPKLYEWVQDYATEAALLNDVYSWRYQKGDHAWTELDKLLSDDPLSKDAIILGMKKHLRSAPVSSAWSLSRAPVPFQELVIYDDDTDFLNKRICSDQHYRNYFAATPPHGSLRESEVNTFLETCVTNHKIASQRFKEWISIRHPKGSDMGESLLNHLRRRDNLSEVEATNVIWALVEGMEFYAQQGSWSILAARRHRPLGLIRFLPSAHRAAFLSEFFAQCTSLAWLSGIVMSAIIDHGDYGKQAAKEEERLFTRGEYKMVRQAFTGRLRQASAASILETPLLRPLLYCWVHAGEPQKAQAWVRAQCDSDDGLVRFFQQLQHGSGQMRLERQLLDTLFGDYDPVHASLHKIAAGAGVLAKDTRSLLDAFAKEL